MAGFVPPEEHIRNCMLMTKTDFRREELKGRVERKLISFLHSIRSSIKRLEEEKIIEPEDKIDEDLIVRGIGINAAYKGRRAVFYVYSKSGKSLTGVQIHLIGATGERSSVRVGIPEQNEGVIPLEYILSFGKIKASYVPLTTGYYELSVRRGRSHAPGSPFDIRVEPAPLGYLGRFGTTEWESEEESKIPVKCDDKPLTGIVDLIDHKMILTPDGRLLPLQDEEDLSLSSLGFKEGKQRIEKFLRSLHKIVKTILKRGSVKHKNKIQKRRLPPFVCQFKAADKRILSALVKSFCSMRSRCKKKGKGNEGKGGYKRIKFNEKTVTGRERGPSEANESSLEASEPNVIAIETDLKGGLRSTDGGNDHVVPASTKGSFRSKYKAITGDSCVRQSGLTVRKTALDSFTFFDDISNEGIDRQKRNSSTSLARGCQITKAKESIFEATQSTLPVPAPRAIRTKQMGYRQCSKEGQMFKVARTYMCVNKFLAQLRKSQGNKKRAEPKIYLTTDTEEEVRTEFTSFNSYETVLYNQNAISHSSRGPEDSKPNLNYLFPTAYSPGNIPHITIEPATDSMITITESSPDNSEQVFDCVSSFGDDFTSHPNFRVGIGETVVEEVKESLQEDLTDSGEFTVWPSMTEFGPPSFESSDASITDPFTDDVTPKNDEGWASFEQPVSDKATFLNELLSSSDMGPESPLGTLVDKPVNREEPCRNTHHTDSVMVSKVLEDSPNFIEAPVTDTQCDEWEAFSKSRVNDRNTKSEDPNGSDPKPLPRTSKSSDSVSSCNVNEGIHRATVCRVDVHAEPSVQKHSFEEERTTLVQISGSIYPVLFQNTDQVATFSNNMPEGIDRDRELWGPSSQRNNTEVNKYKFFSDLITEENRHPNAKILHIKELLEGTKISPRINAFTNQPQDTGVHIEAENDFYSTMSAICNTMDDFLLFGEISKTVPVKRSHSLDESYAVPKNKDFRRRNSQKYVKRSQNKSTRSRSKDNLSSSTVSKKEKGQSVRVRIGCYRGRKSISDIQSSNLVKKWKNYWDSKFEPKGEAKNEKKGKDCSLELDGIVAKGKCMFEGLSKTPDHETDGSLQIAKKPSPKTSPFRQVRPDPVVKRNVEKKPTPSKKFNQSGENKITKTKFQAPLTCKDVQDMTRLNSRGVNKKISNLMEYFSSKEQPKSQKRVSALTSDYNKKVERSNPCSLKQTNACTSDHERKIRFEKAKSIFETLERSDWKYKSLPSKLTSGSLSAEANNTSDKAMRLLKHKIKSKVKRKRLNKKEETMSAPSSDNETHQRRYSFLSWNEARHKPFSERFHVKDLFRDIREGLDPTRLSGIPNREAVLAALRSVPVTPSPTPEPVDEKAAGPTDPPTYQPEYPYLPTTPPGKYKPRSNLEHLLIPWSETLSNK